MTALTEEALAALDAVMASATPGKWRVNSDDQHGQPVISNEHLELATLWHHCVGSIQKEARANAAAIIALHNAYPALRATIDAERARVDAAAAHERARIVAWMRDVGPHWDAKTIISAIIRGDHRSGGNAKAAIHAAKSSEVK
jgi:uncharacterized membrane protein